MTSQSTGAIRGWLSHSRSGRALGGLIADYLGTTSSVAVSFLVTPIIVSLLGAPMYGFWIAASQIIMWLNLLDGGIGINLMKTIAAHKDNDPVRVQRATASTFWCYIAIALATLAIGFSISPRIVGWTHVAARDAASAKATFLIGVITASLTLVAVPTFYVLLQGYQRLALFNSIITGVNTVALLCGVGFVWAGFGVVGMALGQLISTCIGSIIAFWSARKVFRFSVAWHHVNLAEVREAGGFAAFFGMSKLAFFTSNYSDGFLIAAFISTSAVTVFVLSQKLATTAFAFVAKIGSVTMPGLAEMFGHGDFAALQRATIRLTRILTRVGLLSAAMIVTLNHRFVDAWTGDVTFGGIALTVLFAYGVFRDSIVRNLSSFLFAAGEVRMWGILSAFEAAAKVAITILLLPRVGIIGAMIGTSVAELLTAIYAPGRICRLVQLPIGMWAREGLLVSFVRSIPTLIVLAVLAQTLPVSWKWGGMILIGACGAITNCLSFDVEQIRKYGRWILASRSLA